MSHIVVPGLGLAVDDFLKLVEAPFGSGTSGDGNPPTCIAGRETVPGPTEQLVRDLADKVLVLHYGKESACGLPDQVLSDPQVVAAYIGRR
jgi:Branched-chain amino acid ATP-binding cassette transporter